MSPLLVVLLLLLELAVAPLAAPEDVQVTVSLTDPTNPLPHYWKRCFGSGHAALTLRRDWRDSLTAAVHELGLSGVRHHGLLDDDMGVVIGVPGGSNTESIYNFTKISSSWDFQVELGIDPVVELSFMPAYLANCTWHAYHTGNSPPVDPTVNPKGNGTCVTGNFYEGGDMQPQRWEYWYDLVHALALHAVKRYGLDVVKRWHFEVWNEFWGMPFSGNMTDYSPYMRLYNASAQAIKAVHPELKVGGPSSNGGVCCIESFIDVANNMSAPFDFVSGHIYPIEAFDECPDANGGPNWNIDCMIEHVAPISKNVSIVWNAHNVPLFVTEYAVAGIEGGAAHQLDSSSAAAFIFRTIGQFHGVVDMLSYWTFSAIFEERIAVDTQPEFCGQPHHATLVPKSRNNCAFGLMTPRGVRKAGWRGFELLHRHAGNQRLNVSIESSDNSSDIYAMATTNGTSTNSLRVFLSWWANPMYNGTENASSPSSVSDDANSLSARAPAPPCPGFTALSGDCAGHNMQEVSGNVTVCGSACNKTGGCGGFSYSAATNYHNCIMKSINGCQSPRHSQFVFYKRMGRIPPPTPAPPVLPPPTPPPTHRVTVKTSGGHLPVTCTEWRIDSNHANAHKVWLTMGKPARPSPSQMTALHSASELRPVPCTFGRDRDKRRVVIVAMPPDSAVVLDFSSSK